jgi:hypothetical protein
MSEHDEIVHAKIRRIANLIANCPVHGVSQIRYQSLKLLALAFAVNSGGWGIFVVPGLGLYWCASRVKASIKALLSLPQRELDVLLPENTSLLPIRKHSIH